MLIFYKSSAAVVVAFRLSAWRWPQPHPCGCHCQSKAKASSSTPSWTRSPRPTLSPSPPTRLTQLPMRSARVDLFDFESPRTPSLTSEDTGDSTSLRTDINSDQDQVAIASPGQTPPPSSSSSPSPISRPKSNFQERVPFPSSRTNVSRPNSRFSLLNWEFESRLLYTALESERISASILQYLSFQECAALLNTSRDMRELMRNPGFKRVILSRFVPGYRFASTAWDPRFEDREPPTTLGHLSYLSECSIRINRRHDCQLLTVSVLAFIVPLHIYPSHALSSFSYSPLHRPSEVTQWLQALSLSYSRFALILRFRSLLLPFNESWMDRPSSQSRNPSRLAARPNQSVKELVFPAPLSYFGKDNDHPDFSESSAGIQFPPPSLRSSPSIASTSDHRASTSTTSHRSSSTARSANNNGNRLSKAPQPLHLERGACLFLAKKCKTLTCPSLRGTIVYEVLQRWALKWLEAGFTWG